MKILFAAAIAAVLMSACAVKYHPADRGDPYYSNTYRPGGGH